MPKENITKTEVLIVGGGPAGMSAALWCADLGLEVILLEKSETFGGQLNWIFNPIENYLGPKCANGAEMLERFEESIADRRFKRIFGAEVVSLDPETKTVSLADGRKFSAVAVIIATGVRRRRLNIPGEQEFQGKGILSSGSGERETVAGKRVVIIGGGDAAAENALILSERAELVLLVHRRFEMTARPEFVEAIGNRPNVELLLGYVVKSINGGDLVESVTVQNSFDGSVLDFRAEHVLVRIGVEPNTNFLRPAKSLDEQVAVVAVDASGYIQVGRDAQTGVAGIFAVGDAANPISPTIATATGTAATACKAAFALLKPNKYV